MLQLVLSAIGLIIISPIAIPVGIVVTAVSVFCACLTAVFIGAACSWAISKALLWFLLDRVIDWTPFLLDRERERAHKRVNLLFGYCFDCHNPGRASALPAPTTPLKPHLRSGMTSQEWLRRNSNSTGSFANFYPVPGDFENTDGWINDEDDSEALWMSQRRGSLVQPNFHGPSFDATPRSRRNSQAAASEWPRPPSQAPTPSSYTGFTECMQPPSRTASGVFGSAPATPYRMTQTGLSTETQYFPVPLTNSPISLHGRRPSLPSSVHRRNNHSTTSFGSVPEEKTESEANGNHDQTKP